MNLEVQEVNLITRALESYGKKAIEIRFSNELEKTKLIKSISDLADRFNGMLKEAALNGVTTLQVPDQLNVVKITQVEAFSNIKNLNSFIVLNQKNIEVISIQPWLKNHGYEEYLLTYSKIIK